MRTRLAVLAAAILSLAAVRAERIVSGDVTFPGVSMATFARGAVWVAKDTGGIEVARWTAPLVFSYGVASYAAVIPDATATLSLDADTLLRRRQAVPIGAEVVVNYILTAGDVAAAWQHVNIVDVVLVKAAYGTSDQRYDLDGDGLVELDDVVLVKANYNKRGDTE